MNRIATLTITGGLIAAVALGTTGGAVAGNLIGSKDIRDNSVRSVDLTNNTVKSDDIRDWSIRDYDLSPALLNRIQNAEKGQGPKGDPGTPGKDGQDGTNGLLTAYYAEAYYNAGDTNAGAIATVACKTTGDVAISGGVQVLGLDAGANARNTPVSSSFAGRMDWSTNTPRPGRLDGWVVQFGGNAGTVSDKAPEKVKVYALCVPGASIAVENTYTQQ